jgi:hypothetical protein
MSGTGLGGIVLPVVWAEFNVRQKDASVLLEWSTSEEINNDHFIIQRSVDGINFEDVGKVMGAGNTSEKQQYTALDKNPHFGMNYYRLKQVDYDGGFDLSVLKSVYFDPVSKTNQMKVACLINGHQYPVWIDDQSKEGAVTMRLINIGGQVLYSRQLSAGQMSDGNPAITIDKSLNTGIYTLVLTGSGIQTAKKILVR